VDVSLFAVTDVVIPLGALMYGLFASLTARAPRLQGLLLAGLVVATVLTVVGTAMMRAVLPPVVPTRSIVASYASLYFILVSAMAVAVAGCRHWAQSRWLRGVVVILVFLVVRVVAVRISGIFLTLSTPPAASMRWRASAWCASQSCG